MYWVNLPAFGVVSAAKLSWVVAFLSAKLVEDKANGIAIILQANKFQADRRKIKKESDTQQDLAVTLGEQSRGLTVQEARIVFDPKTVFGKRKGFHDMILVTANHSSNCWWKSELLKRGIVTDVAMLGLDSYRKCNTKAVKETEQGIKRARITTTMTAVQRAKQALRFFQWTLQ